ncbi:site-specific DNA-methyltransferase [Jannaschia formosa]|uniref:site-specific DNA-methyltransferase n=1 Tax=Jannaschia formosa TaxID=2259592 RepID=UPI000E1BBFD2|nr:site-specific DNA-methyltransferase [Jannaschia formosa]TFL16709.1 site-specific DNA-methyltransferase [Jannaschia formosa]
MPDDNNVTHLSHGAQAANIPTAEHEPVLRPEDKAPIRLAIAQRDPDMDPQLVWRGKRTGPLEVNAPPIYVQEHVHPKALIEDLKAGRAREEDLFGHFGLTDEDREAEVEFYRHTRKWSNRFILGDSLEVMTSLAEREGLRGKVQAIYVDPPYGIRFNSNFQWSTNSRDVKDGNKDHLTREPEQVRAFRDTWRDGIHSYLGYLRDRLVAARELLTESGSCFVQIGDENVHRVRVLMDEVFGEENFVSQIVLKTTSGAGSPSGGTLTLAGVYDSVLWYSRDAERVKYRQLYFEKADMASASLYKRFTDYSGEYRNATEAELSGNIAAKTGGSTFRPDNLTSQSSPESALFPVSHQGNKSKPGKGGWKTNIVGMSRLKAANRLFTTKNATFQYVRRLDDFNVAPINNVWVDVGTGSFTADKVYIVQTNEKIIQRCLLMTTDPGDLVLDPTAGSGTTAHVAEHWGRRWIAIDTSRVALALARARVMGAKYPAYLLRDSPEGQARMEKEGWASPRAEERPRYERDVAQGFVCERVPHITLKAIANNPAIDTLWERHQPAVEQALSDLNAALRADPPATPFEVTQGGRKGTKIAFTEAGEVTMPSGEPAPAGGLMEWEVPRDLSDLVGRISDADHPSVTRKSHARFWEARIARQRAIDAAIEKKGREDDYEVLHDKPFEDRKKIRVAGPFTVESLSPHRTPVTDEDGELIAEPNPAPDQDAFREAMLENLLKSGVHQAGREDRIEFEDLATWPGLYVTAKGTYREGDINRSAGIFLGPEYGTVSRTDLVEAATEAADAGCDVLIACAFNFDARAQDFRRLGRVPVLHARMHPDLHMAGELKAGGGNLFAVFGEPDIRLIEEGDFLRVAVEGIDIFRPATGEVVTTSPDEIACWFIDTDYSGEAFFVRQAYFPGAETPYKSIRAALKADVDQDAWDSLKRTTSRQFPKPRGGRIAVKVVNHLGDEVMKVLRIST